MPYTPLMSRLGVDRQTHGVDFLIRKLSPSLVVARRTNAAFHVRKHYPPLRGTA